MDEYYTNLKHFVMVEDGFCIRGSIQLIQSDTIHWTEEQLDQRLKEYTDALELILSDPVCVKKLSNMLKAMDNHVDEITVEGRLPNVVSTENFIVSNKKIELSLIQFSYSRFIRRIKIDAIYN
jgi:hypothetical protein